MIEDNWDLVTGNAAHEIEVLNYSNQINVIESLFHLFMHKNRGPDGSCAVHPDESILKEFHRTATLFLLSEPGCYRTVPVAVYDSYGNIIHQPPAVEEMRDHIERLFNYINITWSTSSAQDIAAYALWSINWIHPFKNGNGRTARAFCYACLCLKVGAILGGRKTVIDLIMEHSDEYYRNLALADQGFRETGTPALEPMTEYIDRLLAIQLSQIR